MGSLLALLPGPGQVFPANLNTLRKEDFCFSTSSVGNLRLNMDFSFETNVASIGNGFCRKIDCLAIVFSG